MKKTIICIDRDGTLIYDSKEHLFLGSTDQWQEQVKILPHVVEGLRLLNGLPDVKVYMITNQAGVAISDLPLLTEERAHEVCRHVVEMFREKGAEIDGYFLCPHATPEYVHRKPDTHFHPHLVHKCQCLKPRLGMVFDALQAEGVMPGNAVIYVIGDRASDIQTALNIGGTGILVPFINEPGEIDKVRLLEKEGYIFVAETMLEAAKFVLDRARR